MTRQGLFDLGLKAFLFLSPIFFVKTYQLSLVRGMFFVFGSFALFLLSLAKEPERKFNNVWIALIAIWALFRVFISEDFLDCGGAWFNFWLASAGFIYVFAGVLLFYTVYTHVRDPKNYLSSIMAVAILNFSLCLAQEVGLDFMWSHTSSINGFMETSAQLGQYSLAPAFLLAPWLTPIAIFTLFASKSVSSILAWICGISALAWFAKKKTALIIILLLGLVLGGFNHNYVAAKWMCRPLMWRKTLQATLQKPYVGHGYRSFNDAVLGLKHEALGVGTKEFSRAHCDFLHSSQELGFPIMIFTCAFFVNLWRKFNKRLAKDSLTYLLGACVLAFLVNMGGQTLIRYTSVAGTFIVLTAFLSIKVQGET